MTTTELPYLPVSVSVPVSAGGADAVLAELDSLDGCVRLLERVAVVTDLDGPDRLFLSGDQEVVALALVILAGPGARFDLPIARHSGSGAAWLRFGESLDWIDADVWED